MDPTLYDRWKRKLPHVESLKHTKPLIIGVAGGTCSGKSDFCEAVVEMIKQEAPKLSIAILSQNLFYKKDLAVEDEELNMPNYDKPDSFDSDLFHTTLTKIKLGDAVTLPGCNIGRPCTLEEQSANVTIQAGVDIVLVKGIFPWYWHTDDFQVKVFVNLDSDIRLSERVLRDNQRGRDLSEVLDYYFAFSKRGFDQFTFPLSYTADVIVPNGRECSVGANLIGNYIKGHLLKDEILARKASCSPITPYEIHHSN